MSDFKKLKVWRKSHALALNVHRVASRLRGPGASSLRSQLMRASMSIPTNIVEGSSQHIRPQFARFLKISLNSASELEYHLIVAQDIRGISRNDFESLSAQTIEVRRMLYGLLTRVVAGPALPPRQLTES